MSRRRRLITAATVAVLSMTALTRAATAAPPLADHVPADALVYLGWTGADGVPGYAGTHFKAVVDDSKFPDLSTTFLPQLVARIGHLDADTGQVINQVLSTAGPMWHHPTAFYFGGLSYTPGTDKPLPKLALMCDAGPDGPMMVQQIESLLAQLPPDAQPHPTVTTTGSMVVLALGKIPPVGGGLATSAAFTAALKQCHADGAAVVGYADMQGVVTAIDAAVAHGQNADATRVWPKAKAALGLTDLRQFAMTAGFEGKDWVEREFAGTGGFAAKGSGGIASAFDARPLDADLLTVVPRSADRVSASRADLAAAYDALHDAVRQFDADSAAQVDDAINKANAIAGINLRRDLIGSLGDQWVTYADKTIGGTGVAGSVLVNRLRDPARADMAMTQLSRRLNAVIAQQIQTSEVSITFREQPGPDGTTLHYLAVPFVAPTWAVKGNMLYVGLYPQVVVAAVDEAAHHKESILQRPEFVAVMHRLGDHPANSLSFIDLPAVAPDGYTDLLGGVQLWLGIGDLLGAHAPAMTVPTLRQIQGELTPAGEQSWSDATGWHSMDISPFPGAEAVTAGGGGGGMMQQMMMMSAVGQAVAEMRMMR